MSETQPPRTGDIDVAYVAQLARLHLEPDEIARFQSQLGQVLDYVRQLQELDVAGVEPTAHAMPVQNVFREDKPGAVQPLAETLGNAPSARNGLFIVPRILE